jgi:hypothetical protein
MKRMLIKRSNSVLFALLAAMLCSSLGYGQAFKIDGSDGRWVSLGGGMKSSFRSAEVGAGTYTQTMAIDSLRLYINSELHKDFQVEINTEYAGATSDIRMLDAVVKYQPNEKINIWMGRHLTPSDRSLLNGPYFLSIADYPVLASRYVGDTGVSAGRFNGVSASGKVNDYAVKVKWAFGAYEGMAPAIAPGAKKHFLYAGRVTFNIFDDEPDAGGKSGYYTASTYYGQKEQILAIAVSAQTQQDAVLESGRAAGYTSYTADLLYEKKLADDSVVTVEGAYYKYNVGRNGFMGNGLAHGSAYLLQAAYMFPLEVGRGKFQPIARYQDFVASSRLDIGTNYVIAKNGHNARLHFLYSPTYAGGAWKNRANNFSGGVQVQFQ